MNKYLTTDIAGNTISISDARNNLKDLIFVAKDSTNPYIITNKGKPQAVLISFDYWNNINKTFQKTFIDSDTLPYLYDYTDEEIKEWMQEDKL